MCLWGKLELSSWPEHAKSAFPVKEGQVGDGHKMSKVSGKQANKKTYKNMVVYILILFPKYS